MDTEHRSESASLDDAETPERRRGDRRRRQIAIFVDRRISNRRRAPGIEALLRILFRRKSES